MTTLTIHNSIRQQNSQKTKKPFWVFYQTGMKQKFNIFTLSILDFIPLFDMHSKISQFQFHIKINSQKYFNFILSHFEPMITHEV